MSLKFDFERFKFPFTPIALQGIEHCFTLVASALSDSLICLIESNSSAMILRAESMNFHFLGAIMIGDACSSKVRHRNGEDDLDPHASQNTSEPEMRTM
ncbi:MAG: hypothetical protein IPK50_16415 [Fibrobacterota bacterium]|nr:MAG: hypothetical protein IPK50_16415 [Fibrobacterota bacterium]